MKIETRIVLDSGEQDILSQAHNIVVEVWDNLTDSIDRKFCDNLEDLISQFRYRFGDADYRAACD